MNENIDLTKILKDCPEGFKLYNNEIELLKDVRDKLWAEDILTLIITISTTSPKT